MHGGYRAAKVQKERAEAFVKYPSIPPGQRTARVDTTASFARIPEIREDAADEKPKPRGAVIREKTSPREDKILFPPKYVFSRKKIRAEESKITVPAFDTNPQILIFVSRRIFLREGIR